jgi:hypothetical protein
MVRACCARNVFVHQRSTHVVATSAKQLLCAFLANLRPRHLHVVNEAAVRNATNGMHQNGFSKRWTATCFVLQVNR